MKSFALLVTCLLLGSWCVAQKAEDKEPVEIVAASWSVQRQPGVKNVPTTNPTQREMTADDKFYARDRRAQQDRGSAPDPSEMTVDGRHAAIEKAIDSANATQTDDRLGYNYTAAFVNNTKVAVDVIFWEFRFIELQHPANVVRRQFLCSADLKPGARKELTIFSMLGPSDTISADGLAASPTRMFEERVLINRIEFKDDAILQRKDWRLEDVKKAVERAVSTPWGKEVCRSL
jgi:hypothetical protein